MEEVIKQIIDIEEEAKKIIDDSLKDTQLKEENHRQRILDLEEKLVNDAKEKVRQIRERELNEIKEQEEAKIRRCDNRLVEMNQYAKENMDMWVNDLVKRVLS